MTSCSFVFHKLLQTIADKTAILLFTRTPQQEISQKSLFPHDRKKELQIVSRLISHTQKIAKNTGLPLYTAYSTSQTGPTFGERLAGEVSKVFQNDCDQLIIIGNDCPQLSATLLLEAHKQCSSGNLVLGPAKDGGVYLIALHRDDFDREKFIALDWESENLRHSFDTYSTAQSATTFDLPTLRDVDHPEQLLQVTNDLEEGQSLKRFLRAILQVPTARILFSQVPFSPRVPLPFSSLRAPPVASR